MEREFFSHPPKRAGSLTRLDRFGFNHAVTNSTLIDGVRNVLRAHEVILVHFNTPATKHEIGYPQDLRDALVNPTWKMCYSTIKAADRGPAQVGPGEQSAAFGSVGVLVDLGATTQIECVCNFDAGSNGRLSSEALGSLATVESCEASIVDRVGHNEWLVANAVPLGIFLFPASRVYVRAEDGEIEYDWGLVVQDFPEQRIFSKLQGVWQEFDRPTATWQPRTYDEIVVPPRSDSGARSTPVTAH
ncbi:hypothetical protein [Sphingomonas sp.]|uniref:hypothetical protein n=1 Tax=Sphingomonas sp. TaxID=28214 RepID=UPI002FCAC7EB